MRASTLLRPQPLRLWSPWRARGHDVPAPAATRTAEQRGHSEHTALPPGASAGTLAPSKAGPHGTHQLGGLLGGGSGPVSRRPQQQLPVWGLTPLTPQSRPSFSSRKRNFPQKSFYPWRPTSDFLLGFLQTAASSLPAGNKEARGVWTGHLRLPGCARGLARTHAPKVFSPRRSPSRGSSESQEYSLPRKERT